MDLYFLDHLCFLWILGIINNHITEKSLYFENRPAIILRYYFQQFKNYFQVEINAIGSKEKVQFKV